MQAGDPPHAGGFEITNIAGRPLRVRLVALPSNRGFARKVRLQATVAERTVAAGALAALATGRGRGLRLPAHGSRRIEVSARMAAGTRGYRGAILDVTLEFRARALEASR